MEVTHSRWYWIFIITHRLDGWAEGTEIGELGPIFRSVELNYLKESSPRMQLGQLHELRRQLAGS